MKHIHNSTYKQNGRCVRSLDQETSKSEINVDWTTLDTYDQRVQQQSIFAATIMTQKMERKKILN